MGRANAAVLPVPVWANPRTSRPFKANGIACCWMGVGLVKPTELTPASTLG